MRAKFPPLSPSPSLRPYFFPIKGGQMENCCCLKLLSKSLNKSQSCRMVGRMPKMCAIPQLVLAPLYSITF